MGCSESKIFEVPITPPPDPRHYLPSEFERYAVGVLNSQDTSRTDTAGIETKPVSMAYIEKKDISEEMNRLSVVENPKDHFRVEVCKVDEMKIGEMRNVAVPGQKQQVLLGKGYDGKYFAMGTACSHYGALLKNGVLGDNRIRCPWHGACFNTKTGDIEEYPCVDAVHVFQVVTENETVVISGEAKNVDNQKRTLPMCKRNRSSGNDDSNTVVIVGGGCAGLTCAETLRKENFEGRIVVLTSENYAPYDRTKLSKALDTPVDKIVLRKDEFLAQYDIELWKNVTVAAIDFENKSLRVQGGIEESTLRYSSLVLAVGQHVRTLSETLTGGAWKNIHYLRTVDDAKAIGDAAKGKNVAILGSSFIGMEVAAYLADKASAVTVISNTREPYQASLGPLVGEALKTELFLKKGVKFVPEVFIESYQGDKNEQILRKVKLTNGFSVEFDVLVAGIGTIPSTGFLEKTSLELSLKNRAVIVDEFMMTKLPNVYAAGDCTDFPFNGTRVTIGHWNVSQSQGRIAALSIMGKRVPFTSVPYFWTSVFTKSIRYAGFGLEFNDVFVHGSLNGLKFVAYYLQDDKVVAACSLMYDPVVSRFAELLSKGALITRSTIEEDPELTQTAEKTFTAGHL